MARVYLLFTFGIILLANVSEPVSADVGNDVDQQNLLLDVQDQRLVEIEQRILSLQKRLGKRMDLEVRVSALEVSMGDVESDLDDVKSVNLLQDQRIILIETNVQENEQDIEALVDTTGSLQSQISSIQFDMSILDQRVVDLESNGGGNVNITGLTDRVETLENMTSQLSDVIESQGSRISDAEETLVILGERVNSLESGNIPGGNNYKNSIFEAALHETQDQDTYNVVFEWEVLNPGGHYDNYDGYYTAPVDGYYLIHVQFQTDEAGDTTSLSIRRDGTTDGSHNDAWHHEDYREVTALLPLSRGTFVGIHRAYSAYGNPNELASYAFGYLVAPS